MIIYPYQLHAEWLTEDLCRQVTQDDAVNGGAMLLGLTVLTPKQCSFHSISLLFIANSVP